MYILQNGVPYTPSIAEYANKEIIIAIDSSRTNSCVQVDDMLGRKLADYELRGDPKDDVLQQCKWEREQMSTIFARSKPKIVGIEDIITKKENGKFSQGLEIHMSRFKITAIFMSFICFFQDNFGITPELVNNWAWKSAILPAEYRTESHKKGSLDWHKDRHTNLAHRTDDVTDCDCIMEFLKMAHGVTGIERISDIVERPEYRFIIEIYSSYSNFGGLKKFEDNSSIKIEDKAAFIVNRLDKGEVGYTLTDTINFTAQQIYSLCKGRFSRKENQLALCVRRV